MGRILPRTIAVCVARDREVGVVRRQGLLCSMASQPRVGVCAFKATSCVKMDRPFLRLGSHDVGVPVFGPVAVVRQVPIGPLGLVVKVAPRAPRNERVTSVGAREVARQADLGVHFLLSLI